MKTTSVRLYGKDDLRLCEVQLPPVGEYEILAEVISDSLCMSTYKAMRQGTAHRAVPADVAENPVMVGHEFCGRILQVGEKWQHAYRPGQKFTVQPNLGGDDNIGYSFRWCGGNSRHVIIPRKVIELGCMLPYEQDAWFYGSLAEPMSCIIGAFHSLFHTVKGQYCHKMGPKDGGNVALLAAAGPMGLGAIDYALHGTEVPPRLLVVTDIDDARLDRARAIYPPEAAAEQGTKLAFVNTARPDAAEQLLALSDGQGYDDILVFAAVSDVVEQAAAIAGFDCCINFFAGPVDHEFSAPINFYKVHYKHLHVCGNSGGDANDMAEAVALAGAGRIDPAAMVTHIGGLTCVVDTMHRFPEIGGGKKLVYTPISLPLTAIADFEELGKEQPLFAALADICRQNGGLWCAEAEKYLLENAPALE
ncbi:MAG: zinc-binding dehydrogenase [Christensenellaceae bacterium]|nr:zinc-binding dehydrogenase [Christensenellaceae bacterium]